MYKRNFTNVVFLATMRDSHGQSESLGVQKNIPFIRNSYQKQTEQANICLGNLRSLLPLPVPAGVLHALFLYLKVSKMLIHRILTSLLTELTTQ